MTAAEEWEWVTEAHDMDNGIHNDVSETHEFSIYSDAEDDVVVPVAVKGSKPRRTLSQDYLSQVAPSIIDARAAKEDIESNSPPKAQDWIRT